MRVTQQMGHEGEELVKLFLKNLESGGVLSQEEQERMKYLSAQFEIVKKQV